VLRDTDGSDPPVAESDTTRVGLRETGIACDDVDDGGVRGV
jgi:hypothetical protein